MNVVLINPYCCGGKGISKWEMIREDLGNNYIPYYLDSIDSTARVIKDNYEKGNSNFIAAGGDGTLNHILNIIISSFTQSELSKVKLGAIGLGSSNDFQKPFCECRFIHDIPTRIDFGNARKRDIGCLTYWENDKEINKYFLINASIGITAEANHFFNNPDRLLSVLKKRNTGAAILYAALRCIFYYKNFHLKIHSSETGDILAGVTNLGITKNPNFSGNLRYKSTADYSNGLLDVFLCSNMMKPEILSLLQLLSKNGFDKVKKKLCWSTNKLVVSSEKSFYVEYDGEIVSTEKAILSILPNYLEVCTC